MTAVADPDRCHVVEAEIDPTPDLQIAVWIEDVAGNYVDTLYLTQATGLRGLGNRPGIIEMNSGPLWPYGVRTSVLPIWAHAHGQTFPAVGFQDGIENNIAGSPFAQASREDYFNRPMMPTEPGWDAGTSASAAIFTDKGKLSTTQTRLYPPRADVVREAGRDSADVDRYVSMNPFDAISQATPSTEPVMITGRLPADLPEGVYVLRVEANKERDFNAAWTPERFPGYMGPFQEYGVPYRGQPSVLYETTFVVGPNASTAATSAYAGYGDGTGEDGDVRAPDASISIDVLGSGALRIANVRVQSRVIDDLDVPGAATELAAEPEQTSAQVTFVEPGEDGAAGTATRFEVRYRIGTTMDEASFDSATPITAGEPQGPGALQTIAIDGLASRTPYVVGVRAIDDCDRAGPLAIIAFDTETQDAEVAACGCSSNRDLGGNALLFGLVGSLFCRCRRGRVGSKRAHPRARSW